MQETNRAPLTRLGNTLVAAAFAICFVLAVSLLTGLDVFGWKDGDGTPFFSLLGNYLWPTTQLVVASFLLALPFGYAASRVPAIGRVVRAVPIFWLAVIGVFVVSVLHRGDPTSAFGMAATDRFDIVDRIVHIIGPAAVLAFFQLPPIARFFAQRAAQSPRPSLVGALFGLFARRLPEVVGATILVEIDFAWPGVSRMFFTGLRTQDAAMLAGIVGVAALITLTLRALAVRDV